MCRVAFTELVKCKQKFICWSYMVALSSLKQTFQNAHLRELLFGSFLAFALRFGGRLIQLLFAFMVTRMFGTDALGVFSFAFALLYIIVIIAKCGFDNSLVKLVAEHNVQGKRSYIRGIYSKSLIVLLLFSLTVTVLFFLFFSHFNVINLSHQDCILVAAGILPLTLLSANTGALRGVKMVFQSNLLDGFLIFLLPAALLMLPIRSTSSDINQPFAFLVVGLILLCLLSFVLWWRFYRTLPHDKTGGVSYHQLLALSLPMTLATSLAQLTVWLDVLMLGLLDIAKSDIGMYNIAFRFAFLINFPMIAIASITLPKYSELYSQNKHEEFKLWTFYTSRLLFWTSFPLAMGLMLVGPWILKIFGPDFSKMYFPFVLLCCGNLINAMASNACSILIMTGKHILFQWILSFGIVLNICLNIFLIPVFSVTGAATASLISMASLNLYGIYMVYRIHGFWSISFPRLRFLSL